MDGLTLIHAKTKYRGVSQEGGIWAFLPDFGAFTHERNMDATGSFLIGCWFIFAAVWVASAFSVKRTKTKQPLLQRLSYVVLTAVAALLLNGSVRKFHWNRAVLPHTLAIAILADLVALWGLVIAVWARMILGGNWSARVTLKEDHELIQRGPYRRVRHPIYSGLLLMVLGTAILAGRIGGFIALAICFAGFWIKLRQEELLLSQHLPGYSEYMRRTKALVPFGPLNAAESRHGLPVWIFIVRTLSERARLTRESPFDPGRTFL